MTALPGLPDRAAFRPEPELTWTFGLLLADAVRADDCVLPHRIERRTGLPRAQRCQF